jgi:hypothetical protein
MTNEIALLLDDATRTCPACRHDALDYYVTLRRACYAEAACVETRGPRAGRPYHVAAGCERCGAQFEVAR